MIRIPLPGENQVLLLAPRWSSLAAGWQFTLLILLLVLPAALILWLYRYELRLLRRRAASLLLGIRLLLLVVLWFVAGWQPIVVQEQAEDAPSRVVVAVDQSQSMKVRDPQRSDVEKLRLARALKLRGAIPSEQLDSWIAAAEQEVAEVDKRSAPALASLLKLMDEQTRASIVRRVLEAEGANLLERLAARHQVELFGFDRSAWSVEKDRPAALFQLAGQKAAPGGTDLNPPLRRALQPTGPAMTPLSGVILLTDGQHNTGPAPLPLAGELGERRVPIYAVAIGARQPPPDVAVLEVKTPGNAFTDVDIPVEARVKVTGLPAQDIRVELHHAGKQPAADHVRTIQHDGKDQVYTVSLQTRLEKIGTHSLQIKAAPAKPETQEVTRDNNTMAAVVRVAQDRINVLLVDGEARWEYHYLANALLREKTVSLDRVVFLQPRIGQLSEERLEEIGNPARRLPELKPGDREDPLRKYDCIILGDVLPEHLPPVDRRRLERYVGEHGGTLLLSAGKRAMPTGFLEADPEDPLAKLLPISDPRIVSPESGFALALTAEGRQAPFMQLEGNPQASAERWSELPLHYWGVIGRARPGAAPLAFLPEEKESANVKESVQRRRSLIVRQNYGFGGVLFVGVDSTWRWRYRVGDAYHHRFWSQVIRWAASDKLLPAGNRFVRYGSRQPVYRAGQEVEIAAQLAGEIPLLKTGSVVQARIVPEGKNAPLAIVPLAPAENRPRLLQGKIADLPAGGYRIELDIPDLKSKLDLPPAADEGQVPRRDAFTVQPAEEGEMLDLATNWTLLENLAARSGGHVFTPETVDQLLERLARQVVRREKREPQRFWQDAPLVWWFLGIVLALLSVEWVARKLAGLP